MINFIDKIRYSKRFLIIFTLFFSLIVSGFLSNNVFIAKSPKVNKAFFANLRYLPLDIVNNTQQFLASIFNPMDQITKKKLDEFNKLPVSALNTIGKGVYAKEDRENNIVYIKVTKDAEWEEKEINFQGKIMKVRFPKGTFK